MARLPIYLDYHATTPVDPVVLEAMWPYYSIEFGNPASRSHSYGWKASEAIEIARQQVATLLRVETEAIYFTLGATEGLNLAIKGLAEARESDGKHIITVSTEHPAVLDAVRWLLTKGFDITILPVKANGMLDVDHFAQHLRHDTIMAIVMWANNETGVIHPMHDIGRCCQEAGIPLISDITQAAGKIPVHPLDAGIGIACLSSHKFYGPKGSGAVYIHPEVKRFKIPAQIHGGGHEGGLRSGTLHVPGIVGMGAAAERSMAAMQDDMLRIGKWRDAFELKMLSTVEELAINGLDAPRLPTVSNLRVRMVDSQAAMTRFRSQLAISSGSACSSAHPEPSHVLIAMGLSPHQARGSFRISLGVPTTEEEMESAAMILTQAIEKEREISPVWNMFKKGIDVSGMA